MSSQEGPRLARAADVTGNRIVAVVTKCDLVPTDERRFVSPRPFRNSVYLRLINPGVESYA